MDKRKLFAYLIIRVWHLHMMGLLLMMMLWILKRRRRRQSSRLSYSDGIIGNDESSSMSTATSTHKRRKRADSNNIDDIVLTSIHQMFDKSIEQLKVIVDIFVKGNEDQSGIFNELKYMELSAEDQLDVFALIVEKPHNLTIFKSIQGELKEIFVRKLLGQLRGS